MGRVFFGNHFEEEAQQAIELLSDVYSSCIKMGLSKEDLTPVYTVAEKIYRDSLIVHQMDEEVACAF